MVASNFLIVAFHIFCFYC